MTLYVRSVTDLSRDESSLDLVYGACTDKAWLGVAMASANKQLASPNWAAVSDWSLRVM